MTVTTTKVKRDRFSFGKTRRDQTSFTIWDHGTWEEEKAGKNPIDIALVWEQKYAIDIVDLLNGRNTPDTTSRKWNETKEEAIEFEKLKLRFRDLERKVISDMELILTDDELDGLTPTILIKEIASYEHFLQLSKTWSRK